MPDEGRFHVFGTNDAQPDPAMLLEYLQGLGFDVSGKFRGDDLGWFSGEIAYEAGLPPLQLERFLTAEDEIRADLNRWAAWLETLEKNAHAGWLMQHMISTKQLFTLDQPLRVIVGPGAQIALALCQLLARATNGVYNVNGHGFFAADGTLLVHPDEG